MMSVPLFPFYPMCPVSFFQHQAIVMRSVSNSFSEAVWTIRREYHGLGVAARSLTTAATTLAIVKQEYEPLWRSSSWLPFF